jgi:hypothetical protein
VRTLSALSYTVLTYLASFYLILRCLILHDFVSFHCINYSFSVFVFFLCIALELISNHACVRTTPLELRVVWADEYENPDAVRMGTRLVEDSVHGKSEE